MHIDDSHRARAKAGFGQARQACQKAVKDDYGNASVRVGETKTPSPPADTDCSMVVECISDYGTPIKMLLKCADIIVTCYGSAELARSCQFTQPVKAQASLASL